MIFLLYGTIPYLTFYINVLRTTLEVVNLFSRTHASHTKTSPATYHTYTIKRTTYY